MTGTRTRTHTVSQATGLDRSLIVAGLELLAEEPDQMAVVTRTPVDLDDVSPDEILERCTVLIEAVRHGNVEIPAQGEAEGE